MKGETNGRDEEMRNRKGEREREDTTEQDTVPEQKGFLGFPSNVRKILELDGN